MGRRVGRNRSNSEEDVPRWLWRNKKEVRWLLDARLYS